MPGDSSRLKRTIDELKRRKVVQVGFVYAIVGWLLIQIADASFDPLNLPAWTQTLVVVLIALGFPVALILAWALEVTPEGIRRTRSSTADDFAADDEKPDASIAVVPFANISGNPDNEYFSDGLSEELLNLLARVPDLRVCSRTSSFAFKGKDADMATIRSTLSVGTVLEGSVRRSGDRVRITAQLIDAKTDSHLWSKTYDRELEDIFEVQDEIAASIVDALQLTLSKETRESLEMPSTDNVEAYDFYLRGREFYHRGDKGHLAIASEMYEKAIEIDPSYALAWAGLAICCADHYRYHQDNKEGFLRRANEASRKAVELSPELAEAHTSRGLALWCAEQFDEAARAFEDAIDINPSLFEPYHFYGRMILMEGLDGDAEGLFKQAALSRPEDFQSRAMLASMYEDRERLDDSRAMYEEALAAINSHLSVVPHDVRALYLGALSLLRIGNTTKGREWIERSLSLQPGQGGALYNAACFYALSGEIDRALDLLESSVTAGMGHRSWIEKDPDLDNIRGDPRFEKILASLGTD